MRTDGISGRPCGFGRRLRVAVAAGALSALSFSANADDGVAAAAAEEGALNVYSCDTSLNDVVEAFGERHDLKINLYNDNCQKVYARYSRERGARRSVGDVILGTEDVMARMQDDGYLSDYESPERAFFSDWAKPAGKQYTRTKAIVYGFTAAHGIPTPQDWTDFAAPPPEWKDQIVLFDPRSSSAAYTLLAALHQKYGPEKTAEIYNGMLQAGAELSPSSASGLAKLLSGERAVPSFILNNQLARLTAQGADLDFTFPASGTISIPLSVAIFNDAEHPNAARLFTDFVLTEGQEMLAEKGEYAQRIGLPTKEGQVPFSEIEFMDFDAEKALADQKELLAWWQTVTGVK